MGNVTYDDARYFPDLGVTALPGDTVVFDDDGVVVKIEPKKMRRRDSEEQA